MQHRIQDPESVADHSFRMAVMALILAKEQGLDELKTVKIALVHDLVESIAGDIVTEEIDEHKQMSKAEKQETERKAMQELVQALPKKQATETVSLWEEFEARISKESQFVNELDGLEMVLQAFEYEQSKQGKNLETFFESGRRKLNSASVLKLYDQLNAKRNKRK